MNLLKSIGNTPLIKLSKIVPQSSAEVWIKYEGNNPTGSYKDRMALGVITAAMERGDLKVGDRICEYTGGSTGTAIAFVASILGLKFTAVTSNVFSPSKLQSIRAYGADLVLIESSDGKLNPELFKKMKETVQEISTRDGAYYFDQFGSPDIRPSYKAIGSEIVDQLDGNVDAYCAAVGTGGTLMGAIDGFKSKGMTPDFYALEPLQAPVLTTGKGGSHMVEGIALGFFPPSLELDQIKEARAIDQEKGFQMCRRLAKEEGILAGGSTGLNVVAALALAKELGPGKRVVTIGCDNGIKYLGGHIYS
jgi:cysteine synthase|uniref:PLP-dependent cysteine synthase family protein n=1 Tax=Algoriphagus sp. TaxID=1872435 RepID=UPI004047F449